MPLDRNRALRCLKLSQAMLEQARAGDWPRFEQLMEERGRQLQPLLEASYEAEEADAVRSLVARIKTLDSEALALAEPVRAEALRGIKQGQQGRRMQAAYGKTKRPY